MKSDHMANDRISSIWAILDKAKIKRTPENSALLTENAQYAEGLEKALSAMSLTWLVNEANVKTLFANARNSESLANGLNIFRHSFMLNQASFDDLCKHAEENNSCKYLYTDDTGKFSNQIKTAAFFVSHLDDLKENPSSVKINKSLSEIKPASLGEDIKKILNKMGGYSFMEEDEKKFTMGIEIEYSNIPKLSKRLTEFVMGEIQQGWSHPGDTSVEAMGNGYSGETTTPIISNNSDLKNAMINVAFLQVMGGEANNSCGLHVHIGVENLETPAEFKDNDCQVEDPLSKRSYTAYQLEFMKQFLVVYKREENKFKSIERGYSAEHTQPVNLENLDMDKIETLNALVQAVNAVTRKYEINLRAYEKLGTIEVRRFLGTTEEAQIYGIASMTIAIADEARTRTNAVFAKQFSNAPVESGYSANVDSILKEHITQTQRELFTLRVNPLNESSLETKSTKSPQKPNVVYIHLNTDDKIEYNILDKKGKTHNGTIAMDAVENAQTIIDKLKSQVALSSRETNQLLHAVATQDHGQLSHRVEKLKSTPLAEKISSEKMSYSNRSGKGAIYGPPQLSNEIIHPSPQKPTPAASQAETDELVAPKFHPDPETRNHSFRSK